MKCDKCGQILGIETTNPTLITREEFLKKSQEITHLGTTYLTLCEAQARRTGNAYHIKRFPNEKVFLICKSRR